MARIHADYNYYIGKATTTTLVTGSGKIHAIIASANATTPEYVDFFDNTAGSGNRLLRIYVDQRGPIHMQFKQPLTFETGLTVVTSAEAVCHVTTEEPQYV